MNQPFQATYEHGVLRLDAPLALPEQARVAGVIVTTVGEAPTANGSPDEGFMEELDSLSLDVPVLPGDFSRADMYLDHD